MILKLIRSLAAKPLIQVAALYGVAGVGFAGANLVFAQLMSTEDYGLVALAIALTNLGVRLSPLGLDDVVNRQLLRADRRLLQFGLATATLCSAAITLFGYVTYGLGGLVLLAMALTMIAGGLSVLAAARFQVEHRFVLGTCLGQIGNLGLAATCILMLILGARGLVLPLMLMAATFLVASLLSWRSLLRGGTHESRQVRFTDLPSAISIAGITAATEIVAQLERLLIPQALSLEALAAYGVMAAVAITPYRTLELSVSFTLLPRLRRAAETRARRRVLLKEISLIGAFCAGGGLVIWALVPPAVDWLYAGKFSVSAALVTAGIVSGIVKVAGAVARAAAVAFCSTKELWLLTWFMWIGLGLGALGALYGARWGLVGLIYGASLGAALRTLLTVWLAARHYRTQPAAKPRTA